MKRLVYSLVISGAVALAATGMTIAAPAGGKVQIFATQNSGAAGTILITGAIGDYGTTLSMDKNGKADPNGNFVMIKLHKGTFVVDSTALNAATNKEGPTTESKTTCSFGFIGTGPPVTLSDGTGLYKGISGSVNVTFNFGGYGPFFASGKHKGQCNMSNNAQPIVSKGWITGVGTVSFR